MSKQFQITYDYAGDMTVHAGWVSSYQVGPVRCGPLGKLFPLTEGGAERTALESDGRYYLGGSGRNLIVSGIPITPIPTPAPVPAPSLESRDHNGLWAHGYPEQWSNGTWQLKYNSTGPNTGHFVTDGIGIIASYASGDYADAFGMNIDSTSYGRSLVGVTANFVINFKSEFTYPGTLPTCDLTYGPDTLPLGELTPNPDVAHYVSVTDPRLAIIIDEEGVASMYYDSTVIAIRDGGANDNADGIYYNTAAGLVWNPVPPDPAEAKKLATNPYGILTLTYSWPATPDLDTTTIFAGKQVGYPGPYTAPYMVHSGDNQSPSGSEIVTINLGLAWTNGLLDAPADILCHADWYPAGSSGTATLTVAYNLPGFVTQVLTIQPGRKQPSSTLVATLRVGPDGIIKQSFAPWACGVETRWVPTPPGTVFVAAKFTNAGWNGTAPTLGFAAILPPISYVAPITTLCYPIGVSDGEYIEQIHTGDLSFSNTLGT
jgi:hypothetical protein